MSTPNPQDYLSDYAALGAPVGCDIDELKRCYRRKMRELHPDLNPQLAKDPRAQEALRDLTSAYRHLTEFQREHQRLPGSRAPIGARHTAPRASAPEDGGAVHRRPHRRAWIVAGVLAVASVSLYAWLGPPDDDDASASAATVEPEAPAIGAIPVPKRPRAMRDPLLADTDRGIRVGDTKLAVRAILGPPVIGNDEVWEYGPSHVTFRNGVVTGWFNSPLKPIRVDED
jgi:curved DNA-binding protein CbpA